MDYEALRSAAKFEALAAASDDPHVRATYQKLAQRFRDRVDDPPPREETPRRKSGPDRTQA